MTAPDAVRFDPRLAALGPFATPPTLAVAVSGGADSMALALLADSWARRRGGAVVGLTVDHGLRAGSADEAGRVGAWLATRGIAHHVLAWTGPKPESGIQQAAREARYGLLCLWCRARGVRDLLVAHHRRDQAETFLIRLMRGSGPDGLAAMSAIVERDGVRILRPLLGVDAAALRAFLLASRQEWIEDPSNADPRFARVRARALLGALAWAGVDDAALADLARDFGRRRVAIEAEIAHLAAACCRTDPAGFAVVDRAAWAGADEGVARRLLAAVLGHVGGRGRAPRGDRLRALADSLRRADAPSTATLGGCRVDAGAGSILICRETRGLPSPAALRPGEPVRWDGRFDLAVEGTSRPLRVAPLGRDGWARVVAADPSLRASRIPYPARLTLPMLLDDDGPLAVPFVGYRRESGAGFGVARFAPRRPLQTAGFCLAELE